MDWIRGEKLGHGSFATVSLAVPRSESRNLPPLMAVKSCGVSLSSSLEKEKSILEELGDCPEIIRCYGDNYSCEGGQRLYNVLLEYASGGSLAHRVKSYGDSGLPESEVRRHTKSLVKGLCYIHRFGYVHCDVKLQNILVCADGGARIADFGLARRAEARSVSWCELTGTPMYMSPEMVAGGNQGAPADVWALGCAVAEMAGGAPAWSDVSDVAALMMRIGVGDQVPAVPEVLSEEGKDFLGKCFLKDPSARWTAEMLLDHPFVACDRDVEGGEVDSAAAKLKGGDEENVVAAAASTSPRCPFDFSDWASLATCSITTLPTPGKSPVTEMWFPDESVPERFTELVSGQGPNWSGADEWVTIR